MYCPICGKEIIKHEKWCCVFNWETAQCLTCGFKWDFDRDQLDPKWLEKYLDSFKDKVYKGRRTQY